jgi:hypothetical protein
VICSKADHYCFQSSGKLLLDTNFAATVIAVIEEGSIAGAARRLALTPGAVALRIKMVEAELGATLIGRAGRRIAPTATAARLLAPLRALVTGTADLNGLRPMSWMSLANYGWGQSRPPARDCCRPSCAG